MSILKKRINVITMGCSKNLVDSEHLMRQLEASGFEIMHDARLNEAPVVVLNTCGFIHDARQESVDMILQCADAKSRGIIEHLFVIGCLSELYKAELEQEIPEVDKYFGARNIEEIIRELTGNFRDEIRNERIISTPTHYAWLKIAEGCNRKCAFCSIPRIRGKHTSVPVNDLLSEATFLAGKGVRELLVISQDITCYGIDLYHRQMLPRLIERLCEIPEIDWLRLHYAYPDLKLLMEIVGLMQQNRKICRYIDLPVQHISDKILKNMQRNITGAQTVEIINQIRNAMPDIAIRTTLMVGYPGEKEHDFQQLVDFVAQTCFDRLGVFTYSHEEHTAAALNHRNNIPEKIKQQRAEHIMNIQRGISEEKNQKKIGNTYKVMIDRIENEFYIGRTEYDSPEVDNEVLIPCVGNDILKIGEFYQVEINKVTDFDLYGKTVI